jgi:hypothetical protein
MTFGLFLINELGKSLYVIPPGDLLQVVKSRQAATVHPLVQNAAADILRGPTLSIDTVLQ